MTLNANLPARQKLSCNAPGLCWKLSHGTESSLPSPSIAWKTNFSMEPSSQCSQDNATKTKQTFSWYRISLIVNYFARVSVFAGRSGYYAATPRTAWGRMGCTCVMVAGHHVPSSCHSRSTASPRIAPLLRRWLFFITRRSKPSCLEGAPKTE